MRSKKTIIFGVGVFAFVVALFLLTKFVDYISPVSNAASCEKWIDANVDESSLRAWAIDLLDADAKGSLPVGRKIIAPEFIRGAWKHGGPSVFVFEARGPEKAYVLVAWGSGFMGHWGLLVGQPDFVPGSSRGDVRQWRPGIFFWRDFR